MFFIIFLLSVIIVDVCINWFLDWKGNTFFILIISILVGILCALLSKYILHENMKKKFNNTSEGNLLLQVGGSSVICFIIFYNFLNLTILQTGAWTILISLGTVIISQSIIMGLNINSKAIKCIFLSVISFTVLYLSIQIFLTFIALDLSIEGKSTQLNIMNITKILPLLISTWIGMTSIDYRKK